MRPFAVPAESTYLGSETCGGPIDPTADCDKWQYIFSTSGGKRWITTYWVGQMQPQNDSNEQQPPSSIDSDNSGNGGAYYYPSRIQYSGDQPEIHVNWTAFKPVSQVPPGDFTVSPGWECQPDSFKPAVGLVVGAQSTSGSGTPAVAASGAEAHTLRGAADEHGLPQRTVNVAVGGSAIK